MSKRYGRNQKRKHRAMIAALADESASWAEKHSVLSVSYSRIREAYDDVVRRIGTRFKWSAMLPAMELHGLSADALIQHGLTIEERAYGSRNGLDMPIRWIAESPVDYRYNTIHVPMFVLETLLEEHESELMTELHMLVRGPTRYEMRYAISEDAFHAIADSDYIAHEFGLRCAEGVSGLLKKQRMTRLGTNPCSEEK